MCQTLEEVSWPKAKWVPKIKRLSRLLNRQKRKKVYICRKEINWIPGGPQLMLWWLVGRIWYRAYSCEYLSWWRKGRHLGLEERCEVAVTWRTGRTFFLLALFFNFTYASQSRKENKPWSFPEKMEMVGVKSQNQKLHIVACFFALFLFHSQRTVNSGYSVCCEDQNYTLERFFPFQKTGRGVNALKVAFKEITPAQCVLNHIKVSFKKAKCMVLISLQR